MEGGSSLFGGGALDFDIKLDDRHDAEDLEEQERLRRELEQHLDGLGDYSPDEDDDEDYDEEDEDSVDETCASVNVDRSTNEKAKRRCLPNSIKKDVFKSTPHTKTVSNDSYRAYFHVPKESPHVQKMSTESQSADQKLQMMYEMRVREVQNLGEKLEACQREASAAHDALYSRLAIANAEKERAECSLQQCQELLANSKHHINELEHKVASLSSKIEAVEIKNDQLNAELSATTASLMDAQNRLQAAKMSNNTVQTTDNLFRSQQERHKEVVDRLESEILRTRNKLSEKENALLALEKRFIDMERLKEDLLVEKGTTINKLALELEESQNRLANNDTLKYTDRIAQLTSERNIAKLQVKEMAVKLESTARELVETRRSFSKLQDDMHGLESTIEKLVEGHQSSSFVDLKGSTPELSSYDDKINILRCELTKNVAAQKLKREQIERLQKSVSKRDEVISGYKLTEEKLKKEIACYKESEIKNLTEIRQLKKKLDLDADERCSRLQDELHTAKNELNLLKSRLNNESQLDRTARNSLDKNNSESDVQKEQNKLMFHLTDARKQNEDLKNMYIEVCSEKEKLLRELEELKSCDMYKSLEEERGNVEELIKQLKGEKIKVNDLETKFLNQQFEDFQKQLNSLRRDGEGSRDSLIAEKCKQVEAENMSLRKTCDEQSQSISALFEKLDESKKLITQLNAEIELLGQRDQLIEDMKEKAKQFEKHMMDKKARAENMKSTATSPRPLDSENILPNNYVKKTEVSIIEEKIRQDVAQHVAIELKTLESQYRKSLADAKQEFDNNMIEMAKLLKIKTKEVDTLQELILSERKKYSAASHNSSDDETKHSKCKKQLDRYKEVVDNLTLEINQVKLETVPSSQLREVEDKFAENVQELERMKSKYKIIKKNSSKYKEYIKEKDIHIKNELDRIKQTYEASLRKMHERLQNYISQREKQSDLKAIAVSENKPFNSSDK